jgi:hypothetical protein
MPHGSLADEMALIGLDVLHWVLYLLEGLVSLDLLVVQQFKAEVQFDEVPAALGDDCVVGAELEEFVDLAELLDEGEAALAMEVGAAIKQQNLFVFLQVLLALLIAAF